MATLLSSEGSTELHTFDIGLLDLLKATHTTHVQLLIRTSAPLHVCVQPSAVHEAVVNEPCAWMRSVSERPACLSSESIFCKVKYMPHINT